MSTTRILSNFSSAFFLLSGCWGDLFVIRVFLTCAYAFLLALNILIDVDGRPENYVWGVVCLYLHGSSAVRLFFDEGPVKLDDVQVQEALWRYFYRRSGISRLLFKRYVAPYFELVDVKRGTKLDTTNYFYIILDGSVDKKSTVAGTTREVPLMSGASFDIKHLGPVFRGTSAHVISAIVSVDDTKLFRCSVRNMRGLSSRPESKEVSQGLLIGILSDMAECLYTNNYPLPNDRIAKDMVDEENQLLESAKDPGPTSKSTRSPVFSPLEKFEEPASYLAGSGSFEGILGHILHTLKVKFLIPWPFMKWLPGLRQISSLPIPPTSLEVDTTISTTGAKPE